MAAALRNPRNQKFLILSESDLPLYSPEVMYQQVRGVQYGRAVLWSCGCLYCYLWVHRCFRCTMLLCVRLACCVLSP